MPFDAREILFNRFLSLRFCFLGTERQRDFQRHAIEEIKAVQTIGARNLLIRKKGDCLRQLMTNGAKSVFTQTLHELRHLLLEFKL